MHTDNHHFVFICGLHRSGTSLLHRCLRDHPDISGFARTDATKDEGQFLQSVYPPDCRFGPVNRFGFDPRAHMDECSTLATPENAKKLYSEWSKYWNLEKPVLVEKSPSNLLRTRFLQSLFPNSSFIVILRHPLAVSFATLKWNAERIDKLISHWLKCYETFSEDEKYLNNVFTLKYEDLTTNPNAELDKLFSFLGLDPSYPSQYIKDGLNEKYFQMWYDRPVGHYNFSITRTLARLYCKAKFEHRINRFGYSLYSV